MLSLPKKFSTFATAMGTLSLLLALGVACGGAATEEGSGAQPAASNQQAAQPTAAQSAASGQPAAEPTATQSTPRQQAATAVPIATPIPTPESSAMDSSEKPEGTLNVGQKELGPFMGHPAVTGNPQIFVLQTAPIGESLLTVSSDLEITPMLVHSWEVSEDGSTWTFHLNQGVQFHKGYGELTAEDVIWGMRQFGAEGSKHARASNIRRIWDSEIGHAIAIDDYTVEVNAGTPWSPIVAVEFLTSPGGAGSWIISKKQTDELGQEAANSQIAATGSWDLVEFSTGSFWRMEAVENHWRKTPYFAEMYFREIPEESSRVAGFQTGNLDTTVSAFDSLDALDSVEGAELMRLPGGGESALNIYGQYHVGAGTDEQLPGFDPELPWISASADVNSEEWANAAKVRNALSIAIDRQGIVDTLLRGYGSPAVMWEYGQYEDTWLPPEMRWEYNPERAKQLLAEAGYPDGFSITLTPSLRGAPVEVEACEAIASMWTDIGVDVNFQKVPYGTLRPTIVGRTYQGATCHAAGIRLEPGAGFTDKGSKLVHQAVWSSGADHPWLDEKIAQHKGEVDFEARRALAIEITTFMFENAITNIGLYNFDVVWPVGPRIQPWSEGVRYRDLRNINGYEYIRPRP